MHLIWRFPKIGVPLNHPFQWDFPINKKPSILGYPHLWKPHETPISSTRVTGLDLENGGVLLIFGAPCRGSAPQVLPLTNILLGTVPTRWTRVVKDGDENPPRTWHFGTEGVEESSEKFYKEIIYMLNSPCPCLISRGSQEISADHAWPRENSFEVVLAHDHPFQIAWVAGTFFRSVIYILLQNPQLQEGAEITHAAAGLQDIAWFKTSGPHWKIHMHQNGPWMPMGWLKNNGPAGFQLVSSLCFYLFLSLMVHPMMAPPQVMSVTNPAADSEVSAALKTGGSFQKPIHPETFRFQIRSMVYLGSSWWWCEELGLICLMHKKKGPSCAVSDTWATACDGKVNSCVCFAVKTWLWLKWSTW